MKYINLFVFGLLISVNATAQTAFSLNEAVDYAIKNHSNVKNASVGIQDAELQIKELRGTGLPQITGNFSFTDNLIIPAQLLKANTFDPTAPADAVVKVKFGAPYNGQAGISVNQLLFDASYLIGLRAAETYRKMANQDFEKSKIDIAEVVKKAYYSVLVSQQRRVLLEINLSSIDTAIYHAEQSYKQGFVEKLDIDRLNVQRNNLLTEKQKLDNLIELTVQLLKFQMSYPIESKIILTEKLNTEEIQLLKNVNMDEINPENRVEYQQIMTSNQLTRLNIERVQKGYLPSLFLSGSLGAGHSNIVFNPFQRWFGASGITLGMKLPIYDSGIRKAQTQRQQLNLLKIENSTNMLKQSFQLQNQQAKINIKNGFESLNIQDRNMKLAESVLRTAKLKYQQGLGTNLEVINAETDVKQAQNNYFSALYDILIAKVDLDKAQGNLISK